MREECEPGDCSFFAGDNLGSLEVFLAAHADIRSVETPRTDVSAAIRRHCRGEAAGAASVPVDAVPAAHAVLLR